MCVLLSIFKEDNVHRTISIMFNVGVHSKNKCLMIEERKQTLPFQTISGSRVTRTTFMM